MGAPDPSGLLAVRAILLVAPASRLIPLSFVATRDLLAQRMLRLERRLAGVGEQIDATRTQLERVLGELDALTRLVGRLGRVVDVQGDTLQNDEDALFRKIGRLEGRLLDLEAALSSRIGSASRSEPQRPVLRAVRTAKRSVRVQPKRRKRPRTR